MNTKPSNAFSSSNEPPKKKRKLPSLDDTFSDQPRATDSPALHEGRKRVQPHVAGQWAAHVYVDLVLDPTLRRVVGNAIEHVKTSPPSEKGYIHSYFNSEGDPGEEERSSLHVSLSRPLYLQTNQKADLRTAVAKVAAEFKGFEARYSSFGMLENDEKTRRFLAIEIGQGYQELKDIVKKLDVELKSMRLPSYYESPRFHTSIAWTSLDQNDTSNSPPFEEQQLKELDRMFGRRLRQDELWVGELILKIGKDVHRYRLAG
ncbi:HVSL domain-containing protein [Sporobolomyces salmoneus]|uniref:HVSL domain-containing protein n=1 Tax=Sporobolomyces salmoneus TaxID=183962 RepID=UPI00317A9E2A